MTKLKRFVNAITLNALILHKVKIQNIVLRFLDKLGLNRLFRLINRKKLILLIYHGITPKDINYYHKRYFPKSLFENQIRYLIKKKYKFITLTDWVNIVKVKKKIKNPYIILTFDDGFKNVIEHAYPLMKKFNAKGCLFVITDVIDSNKLIWSDYMEVFVRNYNKSEIKFIFKDIEIRYPLNTEMNIKKAFGDIKSKLRSLSISERNKHLKQFKIPNEISQFRNVPKDYLIASWDELRSLDKNILEIGGHTKTHPNLKAITDENKFYDEIYNSKIHIEKEIGYTTNHFCYPTGYYSNTVINYVKKYNYLTAITVENGLNSIKTDLYKLKRINLDNNFISFKFRVSGLHYFVQKYLKKIFQLLFL